MCWHRLFDPPLRRDLAQLDDASGGVVHHDLDVLVPAVWHQLHHKFPTRPAGCAAGTVRKNAKHLESVSIFDMYKGEQVPEGKKSLSYKLVLRKDGSMTDEEADAVVAKVLKALAEKNITLRA